MHVMKMYQHILLLIISLALYSCSGNKSKAVSTDTDGSSYYGEKIDTIGAMDLAALPTQIAEGDTMDIKVRADITNICQKKGCWMNLHANDTDNKVFVRFKDYAFFMPKDGAGKTTVVSGKLYSNVTTVDELRHYAEDEGKSQEEIEAITEPKVELRMMADGVVIH